MKKKLKKLKLLILIEIVLFLPTNVYAKVIAINDISTEFVKSNIVSLLNGSDGDITASADEESQTFNVYMKQQKIVTFNYTDDYIEYDNRLGEITQETANKDFINAFMIAGVVESILKLSGIDSQNLLEIDEKNLTDTYDTYGIEFLTEPYSFNGTNEFGSWSVKGDFIKYFKVSLDSEKIEALMTKYGTEVSQVPSKDLIANLTPTLKAENVKDDSVTLYPRLPYNGEDLKETIYCDIYRSTAENGPYDKINDDKVDCLNNTGVVDKKLKSDTVYYYKTRVVDGVNFSDVLKVTTSKASIVEPEPLPQITSSNNNSNQLANEVKNEEEIENPDTGLFFPFTAISLMLLVSILIFVYTRKKSVFKKI